MKRKISRRSFLRNIAAAGSGAAAMGLLAGCSYTYGSKDGKFLFDNGILCFRPKYAKRRLYRVSDAEVLALCWKLGLTDDASDGGPLATGRCSA